METLRFTTRSEQYRKTAAARVNTHGLSEKTFYFGKGTMALLLSLVYILNGNHDPKKVQRLNLVLLAIFFTAGLFLNPSLLPLGFFFSGLVLVNGVIGWLVQNSSDNEWNPVEREIEVHIHHSPQKHGRV
jgi:hypothetical protein